MGQTAFTVRIDVEVKKMFDNLCKDFCMSANTAFNMFARYSQSSKLQCKFERWTHDLRKGGLLVH